MTYQFSEQECLEHISVTPGWWHLQFGENACSEEHLLLFKKHLGTENVKRVSKEEMKRIIALNKEVRSYFTIYKIRSPYQDIDTFMLLRAACKYSIMKHTETVGFVECLLCLIQLELSELKSILVLESLTQ
jgi:hypothetical protein